MRIASTIGATSFQHDGVDFEAGEDGLFDVPQHVGEHLVSFGHWETETAAARAAAEAQHAAVHDPENILGRIADLEADVEELRAALVELKSATPAAPVEPKKAPAKKAPAKPASSSSD